LKLTDPVRDRPSTLARHATPRVQAERIVSPDISFYRTPSWRFSRLSFADLAGRRHGP
jgi:hypothetical protein